MKYINLLSLIQAYNSLKKDSYKNFLNYYNIEIRDDEVEDLKSLVSILNDQKIDNDIFCRFYVSYKIPQIGKEFDLLRFGDELVINIELKSTPTEIKIHKQLIRNKYYLSYLGKPIHCFTFVTDIKQLYFLNNNDELEMVDFLDLEEVLRLQKNSRNESVDALFNPSDYLVSPFNSTEKFLKNKYFLTNQQEEIKNNIIKIVDKNAAANFISVTGSAGTGKTLLIYDIVNEIRKSNKKPLIIHCGYLNSGQDELKINGWEIISIKNYTNYDLSNYDVVFIDESQRIYPSQLTNIISKIKSINGNCIFSHDKLQTLSTWEAARDIDAKINNIDSIIKYSLSEKIRTNKEIASFIKTLFNRKRNLIILKKGNIELNYFTNLEDAKDYLDLLDNDEWEILRFTPSQYKNEHHVQYSQITSKTSHKVIGQEFDNVVVIVDQFFSYNENGNLIYNAEAYYHPVNMLFQNITRTRKRLNIVIINNNELLDRCLYILQN